MSSDTRRRLKIVFFGTPEFAVQSLRQIIADGHEVAAVVTATDKPAQRGHHLCQSEVKQFALAQRLEVLQPQSLRDAEFLSKLKGIGADLFVVIAFRMLPRQVWEMPPYGTVNLHASLLPRYRGAAPINWALINGDTETGVTTFQLRHEIDTGDILLQEKEPILPGDNIESLYSRLMHRGASLISRTMEQIAAGTTSPIEQSASEVQPTPAPKIFKDTCRLNWFEMPASRIHNLIRGTSPVPGAWTTVADEGGNVIDANLKVLSSEVMNKVLAPGSMLVEGKDLIVGCANSTALKLLMVQPSGKKPMRGSDYARGFHNFSTLHLQ